METLDTSHHLSQKPVYCLGCREPVSAERSTMQFRTGFFRGHIPLGACSTCVREHKMLGILWTAMATGTPYDCLIQHERLSY
ncbi:diaminopimelate decarboxylase [Paenibacillus sp. UMB4589-SE434]|nr:hypothetical protein [Paenibacillus taiwanensis]MDK8182021.1 diaminopimelate decarboxylase [Paenibacillus sp. UMB4589-SE434]